MATQSDRGKIDEPPLLSHGTQTIGFWQLDREFYEPFKKWNENAERRKYLCSRLSAFIGELRKFDLYMEVWVDGSFTTAKLDPEDIDVAVFVHSNDLENLSPNRQKFFERLTIHREIIRAQYDVDVYLGFLDEPKDVKTYTDTFSKGHYQEKQKGFYKITLNNV